MSTTRNSMVLPAALFLLGLLISPLSAQGQFVQVQGGASDMIPSQGASINFHGPNYDGYFGGGDIDGVFTLGALLKTKVRSSTFIVGDDPIAFGLPTDVMDQSHFFLARGAGVSTKLKQASLFIFAGDTAQASGTPFFQAAKKQTPVRMFFTDIPLSDKLHFYSRNIFSTKQTSIQGLDWRPRAWLKTAVAAGIGSNEPYFAAAADADRGWLAVKAAYVEESDRFRRITVQSPLAPEFDRENIQVTVKPFSSVVLIAGRQNLLQPQNDPNANMLRATVNQLQGSVDIEKFRLGAGLFESTTHSLRSLGESFSASRAITRRIDAGVNYYRNRSGANEPTANVSASVRETVSPKLSLLQVVNHSQGHTNVLAGGNYTNNRITIGIDYQTVYTPFRPNPFSQGISLTLQVKLFRGIQLNAQTFRGPDAKVHYTAFGSTSFNRDLHLVGGQFERPKLLRYIIRGHVRDEKGNPVEGAAIRVGEEVVYTNASGEFFVREKRPSVYPVEVVLPEFLNVARFAVLSAPPTATATPEGAAADLSIVLGPPPR